MRLRSIRLQWFRGASSSAEIDLGGKSVLIYGANGTGKSSFVDAIEAAINGGKVRHLAHEYSGRNQERGLINTERPPGQSSRVAITLEDGSAESLTWISGPPQRTQHGASGLADWDYRRTALRQEELANFINATKGYKYGVVLPLLGLSNLETAAENLRKLERTLERKCGLPRLRAQLDGTLDRRKEAFGEESDEQLLKRIEHLRLNYSSDSAETSKQAIIANVLTAIEVKIDSLEADQRRAAALSEIGTSDLRTRLSKVTQAAEKIAQVMELLIRERLEILGATDSFLRAGGDVQGPIPCPACGQSIEVTEFRKHVADERDRLSAVQQLYDEHRAAVGELCDELARLRTIALKREIAPWIETLTPSLKEGINCLRNISLADMRRLCSTSDTANLEAKVCPLVDQASEDAKKLPPQAQILVEHQNQGRVLLALVKTKGLRAAINRGDALIRLMKELQKGVREEIAQRARRTFNSISADVQRYWKFLQPQDVITDVRLLVPEDNDKAVEVALCFHGKEQESPRLTLSEGQRNALGLCIFLAMANKASNEDRPIILDDVVISLDREHRSRVGSLLLEEFTGRQILLLTHDREWSFELQRTLPREDWRFCRLQAYQSPEQGITFADHGLDITAARARAKTDPEQAMGNIRRIMDVALSEIAERLCLPIPHMRGHDNDQRTAGQFLIAFERAISKSFRKKVDDEYAPHTDALAAIRKTKPLLSIWGNRGTHTFSGSRTEAEELIDACEAVLSAFVCGECGTHVGVYPSTGGKVECRCGALQWRPV